ncbi:MAG: neutral/alkaline non-lysosomal ceramidase N-terminal domain-containing protein, partial [Isosphaeraceae bacterium]
KRHNVFILLGIFIFVGVAAARTDEPDPATVPVGAAVVDVTPSCPVRLMGYGSRTTESEGIASPLKVRALAIGGDARSEQDDGPAVLIAVDNCHVGAFLTNEVARRLQAKAKVRRERLVTCAIHTHCGPALTSGIDFIFGKPIPADQKARIDRYTRELTDALEKVALQALAARAPAKLSWGEGNVGFAANRRVLKKGKWVGFGVNPNGPVDHTLPVLRVTDPSGKIRAVLVNYACHCTTLGGEFNKICAEWAGYACDEIERRHPGATALVIIGCGADANPEPRLKLSDAKNHAASLARETERLLSSSLTPLPGHIKARFRQIELPLGRLPDRQALERRSKLPGAEGFLARTLLEKLDRGETLPGTIPYPVQTWCFGDELAMVFLGGEVVVDYALRIKWETDARRVWVTAYSNDVPCYIASKRVLDEGGYEADMSMVFYGRPTRFAPETEDLIVRTVHDLLPAAFDGPRKP